MIQGNATLDKRAELNAHVPISSVRRLRGLWRSARALVHLLHGALIMATCFHRIDAAARMNRQQKWSIKLLALLGVTLVIDGQPHRGAKLVIANHISWLDILAINAALPSRFVAKSDVRRWPLIGWLVSSSGALYIERERPRDTLRVLHKMADALQAGDTLAVFPEGTTTDGNSVLPFHANLLQAAFATGTPVQPVALSFFDNTHAVSRAASFVGETTLLQSFWSVACAHGLSVKVSILPIQSVANTDRRLLAKRLRVEVQAALRKRSTG